MNGSMSNPPAFDAVGLSRLEELADAARKVPWTAVRPGFVVAARDAIPGLIGELRACRVRADTAEAARAEWEAQCDNWRTDGVHLREQWASQRERAERAEARVVELEAVRDGEVLVDGSWIPRRELSTVLGNVSRSRDNAYRDAKRLFVERDEARAERDGLQATLNRVGQTLDAWKATHARGGAHPYLSMMLSGCIGDLAEALDGTGEPHA